MANKKPRKTKSKGWFRFFLRLFIPKQIRSMRGWAWFMISRIGGLFAVWFFVLTLVFSVLPVPFSAYMAQQKVSHWISGERYPIQYHWVSKEKMSWQIQLAVIAGEDQTFNRHFGFDWRAIQTALKLNAASKQQRGASTISQQTVKNLYLWHGGSWLRKGLEMPLTFLIEKMWDKQRILEIYLNIAEFGEGIFGVEAAAQHFFKKNANQLTVSESALLAASLPNPQIYQVNKPSQTMRKRQQWIMQQMQNLGRQRYLEKLKEH